MAGRITANEVHAWLRDDLRKRSDLGLCKAVAQRLFEPPNRFEPDPVRKPRRWFVLSSILALAAIGAAVYFNFWN
jgi:hypothetical protein